MIALYIHIPFCHHICPYCAFYKKPYSKKEEVPFINALQNEINYYKEIIGNTPFHSIFLGGGTPSSLSESALSTIFDTIYSHLNINNDAEISIEMNPETVTPSMLNSLTKNGINRVSMGVQSFSNRILSDLGRAHSNTTILTALDHLRQSPITNVNLDLIFASQHSSIEQLQTDLEKTLAFDPNHISTYALTIEENTPFHKRQITPIPDHDEVTHFDTIINTLTSNGYKHYEVSAFAKPGYESIHNLSYWTLSPYIGLGPSASSFFKNQHYQAPRDLQAYITNPTHHIPDLSHNAPNTSDTLFDYLNCHLRLLDGLNIENLNHRFNINFESLMNDSIQKLIQLKLITKNDHHITLTRKGLYLLNEVLLELHSDHAL